MTPKNILIIAVLAALSVAIYLLASGLFYGLGFPLDDSWIHQTYARNLAQLGEWSFIPGQPSAGSTGPLWGILLSMGHFLNLGPYVWTYILGGMSLCFMGLVGYIVFPFVSDQRKDWRIWAAVLLVFEWHLVWAAASGMETLAFAAIASFVLGCLVILEVRTASDGFPANRAWFGVGLLTGLSVWLRPEGVTLWGPVLLGIVLFFNPWRDKARAILLVIAGFLLILGPYLLFNHQVTGSWLPNTFYAKQAEYAFLHQQPLWRRFLEQAFVPLKGVGALLLPGFLITIVNSIRKRRWAVLLASVWVIGFLLMYAWRLPVTYQYGR